MRTSQRRSSQRGTATALIIALFLCLFPALSHAQGTLIPFVPQTFYDASGNPCASCKLYTYAAGTSTAQATYSDITLATPNANPVVMNAGGRPSTGYIFLSATSYKFTLTTSADVTIWTVDNVTSIPTTSGNTDITGTAGEALSAGDCAYLSDGSGSLTAGRWYKCDADLYYGSIHPILGFVPTAIANAASGTIRIAGTITLSGLSAGSTYYVSGTAAAVTSTAPANARKVGQAISTTSLVIEFGPAWLLDAGEALGVADGRLTLTSGTAVTTADVTAAGTIYYTPYQGNRIGLFDGSKWKAYAFTELSLAVTCTAANTYDVWVYDNAGTLTLETSIWTNATTRATALALQNGVYAKTGALTRRYVGTFYCTGTNQVEDSFAKRHLWNYYHRVQRAMRVLEATNSWTYSTLTWRQANASTANQLDLVVGVAEVPVRVSVRGQASNSGAGVRFGVGIGADSTSALATGAANSGLATSYVAGNTVQLVADLITYPAVGRHFYAWLEISEATITTTWYGDNGQPTIEQTGILGWIEG